MNLEETRQILSILKANYQAQFTSLGKNDGLTMLNLWSAQFANIPYKDVLYAVNRIIKYNKFIPTIAEVNDIILLNYKICFPKFLECWTLLKSEVQKSFGFENAGRYGYDTSKIADGLLVSLPEFLKEIVNESEYLEFCNQCLSDNKELYIRLDFEKRYNQFLAKEKEDILWSRSIAEIVERKKQLYKLNINQIQTHESDSRKATETQKGFSTTNGSPEMNMLVRSVLNASQEQNKNKDYKKLKNECIYKFIQREKSQYDILEDLVLYGCNSQLADYHVTYSELSNGEIAEIDALRKNKSLMQKVANWQSK